MCHLDLSETNKGGLGFSSNLSMMARDPWRDETRVWLGLPGYPHLHFPGDWYIPPPHTSGPIRALVDKHWPIRGQYPPCVVSRCQVPSLCGNTDQGSLLWPTPASQCGMTKSNILKWGYIFQDSSSSGWNQSPRLCISYSLTFLWRIYSTVEVLLRERYSQIIFEYFNYQMCDIFIVWGVEATVWCIFAIKCPEYPAYFFSIKPFSGYIHKIDSQYRVFPAAALWPGDRASEPRGAGGDVWGPNINIQCG